MRVKGSTRSARSARNFGRGLVVALIVSGTIPARADLAEKLPEPLQNTLSNLAEAHRPSAALMEGPLDLQRSRLSSGTAWLPSASPMYGLMSEVKGFGFLVRGNIFAGFAAFDSDRGMHGGFSSNTLLGIGFYRRGLHELMPRIALSWEALTNGQSYPHLLQTETDQHELPYHDQQTPQDVFAELSLTYTLEVSARAALQVYAAVSGQPALGPSAYNYRVSAFSDPLPPLSQDVLETGNYFGVLTVGGYLRWLKLEASIFNAKKSARHSYDLDFDVPRSLAFRATVNPSHALSLQLSYAALHVLGHASRARSLRATASLTYNHALAGEANWATTAAFGARKDAAQRVRPAAFLESTWNVTRHHTLFGRAEVERVSGAALGVPTGRASIGHVVLGYVYYFRPSVSFAPGIGARFSVSGLDRALSDAYGTRAPVGGLVYIQLRPAALAVREPQAGSGE